MAHVLLSLFCGFSVRCWLLRTPFPLCVWLRRDLYTYSAERVRFVPPPACGPPPRACLSAPLLPCASPFPLLLSVRECFASRFLFCFISSTLPRPLRLSLFRLLLHPRTCAHTHGCQPAGTCAGAYAEHASFHLSCSCQLLISSFGGQVRGLRMCACSIRFSLPFCLSVSCALTFSPCFSLVVCFLLFSRFLPLPFPHLAPSSTARRTPRASPPPPSLSSAPLSTFHASPSLLYQMQRAPSALCMPSPFLG